MFCVSPNSIIPGVSSAMAGAAILGQELTIPEISQTVIFTRFEGRTPVSETEKLRELAKHRATTVIFLSVGMIERIKDELLHGYPEDHLLRLSKRHRGQSRKS